MRNGGVCAFDVQIATWPEDAAKASTLTMIIMPKSRKIDVPPIPAFVRKNTSV